MLTLLVFTLLLIESMSGSSKIKENKAEDPKQKNKKYPKQNNKSAWEMTSQEIRNWPYSHKQKHEWKQRFFDDPIYAPKYQRDVADFPGFSPFRISSNIHELQSWFKRVSERYKKSGRRVVNANNHKNKEHLFEALVDKFDPNLDDSGVSDINFDLFRVDNTQFANLRQTLIKNVPEIKDGKYQSDESVIVDFADWRLGGGVLRNGFAMEEILFMERFHYLLMLAARNQKYNRKKYKKYGSVLTTDVNEAWILSPAKRFFKMNIFGHKQLDDTYVKYPLDQRFNVVADDDYVDTHVIAIDAMELPTNVAYKEEWIIAMIQKAFAGFAAAKSMKIVQDHIATGPLGTGVFKNNANVMFAVQAIAAELADVKLLYYCAKEEQKDFFREHCVNRTAEECVKNIVASGVRTNK